MKSHIGAAALMVAIGSGGADAQSLNDKLYRAQEEEMLVRRLGE
jgi:hypothetical protein